MISNLNYLKVFAIGCSCKALTYNVIRVAMLANLLVIIGKVKSVFLGVVFCKKIRGVIITKTHIYTYNVFLGADFFYYLCIKISPSICL